MKRIWFDITNTPQVHFLVGISKLLSAEIFDCTFTARDFSETVGLLRQKIGNDFLTIGSHYGKSRSKKIFGLGLRLLEISRTVKEYDISISNGSESAIWLSAIKGKPSIAFGDNDLAKQWTYSKFVNHSFFPSAVDPEVLKKQGLKNKFTLYDGFKEDIYISSFEPDVNFKQILPFDDYVVLRAENLQANYVSGKNSTTIIPELLELLIEEGLNVVFLPRYASDRELVPKSESVYIPDVPLDGLNLVYHSKGVFTGAGTLAREAACMNIPSFSFFAGDRLLAVDQAMVKEGKMFFSRQPSELVKAYTEFPLRIRSIENSKLIAHKLALILNKKLEELL